MKKKYLIGAHLSVTGGFFKAIINGESIGCTAIQIFTKSNRQWCSKEISTQDANLFAQTLKSSSVQTVIAHASYLINLCSNTQETQEKSYRALIDEINRCNTLNIPLLVLHPGSSTQYNQTAALEVVGKALNKAIEETSKTTILIETMAGQGNSIGGSFEQIAQILSFVKNKKRVGVCFDTCHVFAAGYNFCSPETYKKVFEDFDKTIGLEYLKAFHINDSKKPLGSRVDRHENIGQGCIPLQAFEMIINDDRFQNVPKILETPHGDDLTNDKKNLDTIIQLIL